MKKAVSKSNLFITFEGSDGAGKSTLMQRIEQELASKGQEVISTRAPGGTSLGTEIRELLLTHKLDRNVSPQTELLLFLADRVQHIHEVILPALQAGKVVLSDRFNDSTIAYQGYARGLGVKFTEDLCNTVCENLKPDITFYLDIDPELGLQRVKKLGARDRMESEKLEFYEKVRAGFLLLAEKEPSRIHILDAHQTADEVFTLAMEVIGVHV